MKLRYMALVFTLLIGCVMLWAGILTAREDDASFDMLYYNELTKQIEAELAEISLPAQSEKIEEKYQCDILFLIDNEYQRKLLEQIEKESIILDYCVEDTVVGKIIFPVKEEQYLQLRSRLRMLLWGSCIAILLMVYMLLFILYRFYVRPFRTLQEFTAQVAKGNLELPLPIRKYNYFGAFTESFDIMRQELKRARESEYQANVSKKELIAKLSHDIKTPVATIKAACEVMQLVETKKETLDRVGVIANKAEMIDNLISNMFHATLEELEVLKVENAQESSLDILQMFQDFQYYGKITLENEIPACLLYYDKLRLQQVIDNVLNNSYKYAGTEVKVSFSESAEGITVFIRDSGEGAPEEEIALLWEKYYRGSNTKGKSGSGLGLYLARNFMLQMGGDMECYNQDGFVVSLFLHKV